MIAALLTGLPESASSSAAADVPRPGWTWPLQPRPQVVRIFDPPDKPWLSGHRGVDLSAPPGFEVRSPAAGTVSFKGWVVNRPVITISHGNGLRSSFEPVESPLQVGDRVAPNQVVGTVAAAGTADDGGASHCSGACLHWGVRNGDDYVDPLSFLIDRRPSVLLPLDPPGGPAGQPARADHRAPRPGNRPGGPQTIAEMPVMARPVTSVLISWVPS